MHIQQSSTETVCYKVCCTPELGFCLWKHGTCHHAFRLATIQCCSTSQSALSLAVTSHVPNTACRQHTASPYGVPFTLAERDTPRHIAHEQTATESTLPQQPSQNMCRSNVDCHNQQMQAASSISLISIRLTSMACEVDTHYVMMRQVVFALKYCAST